MALISYEGMMIPLFDSIVMYNGSLYGLSKDDDEIGYSLYKMRERTRSKRMHFTVEKGALLTLQSDEDGKPQIICGDAEKGDVLKLPDFIFER